MGLKKVVCWGMPAQMAPAPFLEKDLLLGITIKIPKTFSVLNHLKKLNNAALKLLLRLLN